MPSFVSILKQIVEHRLPKAYDYHRVPAPFLQVKLLKILAALAPPTKPRPRRCTPCSLRA